MGMQSSIGILTGATSSQAGGSATTFSSLGPVSAGKAILADLAATDFKLRKSLEATVKAFKASVSAIAGYTQQRNQILVKVPKLLANGKYTINTVKVELAYDPETTAAERQILLDLAQSVCVDAETVPVLRDGNLA